MTYRFGQFLVLIGGLLFILFALTLQAQEINYYLCAGAGICLLIGIVIIIQYRATPSSAHRFRTFNKIRGVDDKGKGK